MTPLLSLLRLVTPTLPVGGYSYSRGLEAAVEAGHVHDAASAETWIAACLGEGIARVDVPALGAAMEAMVHADWAEVERLAHLLLALRESAEFHAEDRNMGQALARLLIDLQVPHAERFTRTRGCSFCILFGLAASTWQVPVRDAQLGYLWLNAESQVQAALRLIPLGQTDGQRVLGRLGASIDGWVEQARALPEDSWGSFLPGLAIASAEHESQFARLFRS